MRRHLDPLQLEQLHNEHQPRKTPVEWIADVAVTLCLASFISAVCIALVAYAVGQLPRPTP